MYVKRSNNLGEWDFSKIIGDVVTGYTAVEQAKTAREVVKLQAQQAQQGLATFPTYYSANPQYSPQYTMPAPASNMMPLVLIGGAALLLFFLMKD